MVAMGMKLRERRHQSAQAVGVNEAEARLIFVPEMGIYNFCFWQKLPSLYCLENNLLETRA